MSKILNHVIALQENPCYEDGWKTADNNKIRHCPTLTGFNREAWFFGYDARKHERDIP